MDALLDRAWTVILEGLYRVSAALDSVFAWLHPLGPALAILVIVLITVALTKWLSHLYQPNRYRILQSEFQYWYDLRRQALQCGDPEKAKGLAKNIDQAKLNRVYYDYFFEGLLRNLITVYIPSLLMLAYVNEAYRPERLSALFGKRYIFQFNYMDGSVITIGAVFWFVLTILAAHLLWPLVRMGFNRVLKTGRPLPPAEPSLGEGVSS